MPKTFDEFLREKCFEEYPQTLDDDMEDVYERWTSNLDIDELMVFADEALLEARKDINRTPIKPF